MPFKNRHDAGQQLGQVLASSSRDFSNFTVVGLARGGVIVAAQIAEALGLPLLSLLIDDLNLDEGRTIVMSPFGTGRLFTSEQPSQTIDSEMIASLQSTSSKFASFLANMIARHRRFNAGLDFQPGASVLLIDDGLVSGKTMWAAIECLTHLGVRELVVGVPVMPGWVKKTPFPVLYFTTRVSSLDFPTTGMFYRSFDDVPDEEVIRAVQSRALLTAVA